MPPPRNCPDIYDALAGAQLLKNAEVRKQSQIDADLDMLGNAQQLSAELVDRLTARLGPVLGPAYPSPCDDSDSAEPMRCAVAGRVRVSYGNVVDINSRITELLDRLQV